MAAPWIAAAVLCLPLGSAERVGWLEGIWLEGICVSDGYLCHLGWLRCIPLQLVLAAVVAEMSMCVFVKVSVAVAAGTDDHTLLACFECF